MIPVIDMKAQVKTKIEELSDDADLVVKAGVFIE